jgi:hypothetical protein
LKGEKGVFYLFEKSLWGRCQQRRRVMSGWDKFFFFFFFCFFQKKNPSLSLSFVVLTACFPRRVVCRFRPINKRELQVRVNTRDKQAKRGKRKKKKKKKKEEKPHRFIS